MSESANYSNMVVHLWELLEIEHYSHSTKRDMRFITDVFTAYMESKGLTEYEPNIGERLIAYCRDELHVCASRVARARSIVDKLNRLFEGYDGRDALWAKYHPKQPVCESMKNTLVSYIEFRKENGIAQTTQYVDWWTCTKFLDAAYTSGCVAMNELSPQHVQKAMLSIKYMKYWERIRKFLHFLFETNVVSADYSRIIPYRKKQDIYPTVYSPEEIRCIEQSIDRTTHSGKRDFAIVLLLSRYGIRSRDVAALTFDNIDFVNDRIAFIQKKTSVPWEAELLEDVKEALLDYINNGRPKDNSYNLVFLTAIIPHKPINSSSIDNMVNTIMSRSPVDIKGRRHGSRIFRSSISTNMVNAGVSTEIVRKVLGHETEYALRHYAKIDIESMRICPLSVPEPKGKFAKLLCMKEEK